MSKTSSIRDSKSKANLVLIGFASSGKTVVGKRLANVLKLAFLDLDRLVEAAFLNQSSESLTCRQIFKKYGEDRFRQWESDALKDFATRSGYVLATGGGTPMRKDNFCCLSGLGIVIYLTASPQVIFDRFEEKGCPAYLEKNPTVENLSEIYKQRDKVYKALGHYVIDTSSLTIEETVLQIMEKVGL